MCIILEHLVIGVFVRWIVLFLFAYFSALFSPQETDTDLGEALEQWSLLGKISVREDLDEALKYVCNVHKTSETKELKLRKMLCYSLKISQHLGSSILFEPTSNISFLLSATAFLLQSNIQLVIGQKSKESVHANETLVSTELIMRFISCPELYKYLREDEQVTDEEIATIHSLLINTDITHREEDFNKKMAKIFAFAKKELFSTQEKEEFSNFASSSSLST